MVNSRKTRLLRTSECNPLKSLKIQPPPPPNEPKMASLSNSRSQERPNRFKSNGDMAESAKHYVDCL